MASKERKPGAQPPHTEEAAPKGNGGSAPPVWSKRMWTGSGSIDVAVFRHTISGSNGDFIAYSTATKRSWKDGDDYKESKSFRPEDLLPLGRLLGQAYDFISDQGRE